MAVLSYCPSQVLPEAVKAEVICTAVCCMRAHQRFAQPLHGNPLLVILQDVSILQGKVSPWLMLREPHDFLRVQGVRRASLGRAWATDARNIKQWVRVYLEQAEVEPHRPLPIMSLSEVPGPHRCRWKHPAMGGKGAERAPQAMQVMMGTPSMNVNACPTQSTGTVLVHSSPDLLPHALHWQLAAWMAASTPALIAAFLLCTSALFLELHSSRTA